MRARGIDMRFMAGPAAPHCQARATSNTGETFVSTFSALAHRVVWRQRRPAGIGALSRQATRSPRDDWGREGHAACFALLAMRLTRPVLLAGAITLLLSTTPSDHAFASGQTAKAEHAVKPKGRLRAKARAFVRRAAIAVPLAAGAALAIAPAAPLTPGQRRTS